MFAVIENAGTDLEAIVSQHGTHMEAMKAASKFSRKAANPACVDVVKILADGSWTTEI